VAMIIKSLQRVSSGTRAGSWRAVLLVCLSLLACLPDASSAQESGAAPEPVAEAASVSAYADWIAALPAASYSEKAELVERMLEQTQPGTLALLTAFLDGRLYSRSADAKVFIVNPSAEGFDLSDPVSGAAAGSATEDALERIGTNNSLRKTLKGAIARLKLSDPDPQVRLAAIEEMLRSLDESAVSELRAALEHEQDAGVHHRISLGLAMADLSSEDAAVRLKAIQTLDGDLSPEVYNRLQPMTLLADNGSNAEPDAAVRTAAMAAIRHIEFWRDIYSSIETLFFGLSLGSVLVLAAIGLAITFGVMGIINMAHGELIMIGAYTTYVMQLLLPQHTGLAVLLSVPAAFVVSGLVGIAIERGIVKHLYGRPLETLLATFGLSLILQQAVRSIFSPLNRSVATPEFMSGVWQLNGALAITYNRLYIVIFTMLVFVGLQLVMKRTSLGLKVRAVSQNRRMARAMGVRSDWVDAATFGLGSGIAGIAGVALSQLTNVGPNLGQAYIIDSFMVVVFGGVGNLWGTLIGGMTLGVVNKLLEPYAGAVLAKILVLVALILFIQRRPRGLFPQKGRAAEGH